MTGNQRLCVSWRTSHVILHLERQPPIIRVVLFQWKPLATAYGKGRAADSIRPLPHRGDMVAGLRATAFAEDCCIAALRCDRIGNTSPETSILVTSMRF